jgi:sugar phosphate isomerase/epimerase
MAYAFHGLLREGAMDIFGYLESSKYRYGLLAADFWNGFFENTDESYLQQVRDALDERELDLSAIAVDQAHVWDDDAEVREQNHKNAWANLHAARILRPRFVRIDAGGRDEDWTNEAFDHIVMRFKEYADFAREHGFKVGAENHWGPENYWPHLRRLYTAVDHPAFGLSCHIGGWAGTDEEKRTADRESAPWVCTTHIDWNICTGPLLEEKLANLWNVGYDGYYSVEHHTAKNEYAEVAIQLGMVRRVLERYRDEGVPAEG